MVRLSSCGFILLLMLPATAALGAPGPSPTPVPTETIVVAPGVPESEDTAPAVDELNAPGPAAPAGEIPVVEYDFSKLPPPVARLRDQIITAAASGDPEALRIIIDAADPPPDFGGDAVADPIMHLVSLSGDAEGREILAIIIEVLEAGYVHVDVGTPDEMFIWPYFARYPVDALTPPQLVEMFKLVFAGDYEDMLAYGFYTSYRIGIGPNGGWRYFLAD